MASLEQLSTALRNADAAGDVAAARVLASEIVKLRDGTKGKGVLGYLGDVGQSIAQGVTFGYGDEIAAKAGEMVGVGDYQSNVDAIREREKNISPWISVPGQVAGAVGATLAALPVAAPIAAAAGATRVGAALSQLPRAVGFGALGASEGALAGSGAAVEGQRLQGAVEGAPFGAVVGTAAPYVASGVAGLFNRMRNVFSPQANVAADLGRALKRDDVDPATLLQRFNDASIERGGTVTLADVGGENVRGLVERVAQTPGGGRAQIIPRLTSRQQEQAARIGRDLRQLTGTNRSGYVATQEVMAERVADSSPLYREVFSEFDIPIRSEQIDTLLGSDLVVTAMKRAVSSGKDRAIREGLGAFNPKVRVTDDGRVVFQKGQGGAPAYPNLQFWDQVKRELDQLGNITGREGAGDTAGNARGLAKMLRTELDRITADPITGQSKYTAARDAWSGPSAYLEAVDQGRNILLPRMSAEEMTGMFNGLSASEQSAFREGAISAIVAKMGSSHARVPDFTQYLRSPEMRAKIAAIMPTPDLAQTWARRLEFESGASELANRAMGNSATYRRAAERADAEGIVVDLAMDALSGAGSVSVLRRLLTAAPRWARDHIRARADKELGDLLTNPYRAQDLHNVLLRASQANQPISVATSAATTAGGVAIGQ